MKPDRLRAADLIVVAGVMLAATIAARTEPKWNPGVLWQAEAMRQLSSFVAILAGAILCGPALAGDTDARMVAFQATRPTGKTTAPPTSAPGPKRCRGGRSPIPS